MEGSGGARFLDVMQSRKSSVSVSGYLGPIAGPCRCLSLPQCAYLTHSVTSLSCGVRHFARWLRCHAYSKRQIVAQMASGAGSGLADSSAGEGPDHPEGPLRQYTRLRQGRWALLSKWTDPVLGLFTCCVHWISERVQGGVAARVCASTLGWRCGCYRVILRAVPVRAYGCSILSGVSFQASPHSAEETCKSVHALLSAARIKAAVVCQMAASCRGFTEPAARLYCWPSSDRRDSRSDVNADGVTCRSVARGVFREVLTLLLVPSWLRLLSLVLSAAL